MLARATGPRISITGLGCHVPERILERMHDAFVASLFEPDISARFAEYGVELSRLGRAEVRKFVDDEIERWSTVVRESGAKTD